MKKFLIALLSLALTLPAFAGEAPLVIQSGQVRKLPAATALQLNAPTTASATITLPHGTPPTSPNNGDCWTTTAGLYCRISGATVGPYGAGGGTITLTGDINGTGSGSFATAIGTNVVTLAKMAQVATATFLGRITAATGNVEALTATQATALLNPATTSLQGAMSAADKTTLGNIAAWTAWTPTITADAGTFTTVTINATETRWQKVNKTVIANVSFQIASVGTATGSILISPPVAPSSQMMSFGQDISNARALAGGKSGSNLRVSRYDAASPIVAGAFYYLTMIYEIP